MTARAPVLDTTAWGLLLALSLVWGGSFFFAEVALAALPPLTIVLARLTIGAAGLWLIIAVTRTTMPSDRMAWRDLAVMGILNNAIPFGLIVCGGGIVGPPPAPSVTGRGGDRAGHLLDADRPASGLAPGAAVAHGNTPIAVWGSLAGIGLLSTSVAYLIFFAIVRRAGGSNVMLVTLMIPPSAILLGVAILDEPVSAEQIGGLVLIAMALLTIDGRLLRRWRAA